MSLCACRSSLVRNSSFFRLPFLGALAACAIIAGCGGGSGTGPTFSGTTAVTVLASSTANDQLQQYGVSFNSLTLTSQSGKAVNLISSPVGDEFIHLNGTVEPLATATVPQGIYDSASVNVSTISAACEVQSAGSLNGNGIVVGVVSTSGTVKLPGPITIGGTAMGLVLNLQVSQSTPLSGGCPEPSAGGINTSAVFTLAPLTIASQPTNSSNGRILGLRGVIAAVAAGGTGMTVNGFSSYNTGYPPAWTVTLNGSTAFQGVSGASQLQVGAAVDLDATMQQDGSLLATRVEALNANPANLGAALTRMVSNYSAGQKMTVLEVQQSGHLPSLFNVYSAGTTTFQVSGQFTNLQSLPFSATFDASNIVAGQNMFFGSNAADVNGFTPLPTPATTVTLLPQTIDGTVSSISGAGGFTTYAVRLATYDMFPNLAVQPGLTTLLTNPDTVVVYADSNTQMLNTSSIAVGSVERFYGLVFNDNGTLRMDCAQVNDGVAE